MSSPDEFHDVHPVRDQFPPDEAEHRRTGNTLFTSGPLRETIQAWCEALGITINKGVETVKASFSASSLSAVVGQPPAALDYSDRQPVAEADVPFTDGGGLRFTRHDPAKPKARFSTPEGATVVNRGAW